MRDLCGFQRGQERRLGLLGLREPGSRGLGGPVERGVPLAERRQRGLGPGQPLLVGLVGAAPSVELAPHLGRGPRRPGGVGLTGRAVVGAGAVGQVVVGRRGAARGGRLLVRLEGGDVRLQGGLRLGHRRLLGPQPRRLGLEAGGDARVHQLHPVALQAAPALVEHGRQAAGPLPQLLDAHEQVAEVGRAAGAQAGLGRQDLRVHPGQVPPHGLVLLAQVPLLDGQALQPPLQARDLPTGDVDPQRGQLGDHLPVAAGGLGLALQRAQLAAHLAQQVLDPQQAGLRGVEPALGPLLALAVLEDAGRLLDHGPPVLRAGVEDGVDLALADDHVLLAADARIAEELLDVEQAAGDAVDGVLAVARAPERAGQGDLGELDRQQAVGVVDGQADLGPAERGPLGRPGEDDVVHLLAAHRARGLRAQHPGDGVDDVGLAAAVRADDHGDPRLEGEHGRLGEGLEALEGQLAQEHGERREYPRPPVGPRSLGLSATRLR